MISKHLITSFNLQKKDFNLKSKGFKKGLGGILSKSYSVKIFEFLRPFNKVVRNLRKECFALYQFYIELKTKKFLTMPGNVLPLHLVFSSSQNSNVDNICWISTRFCQGLYKSSGLYPLPPVPATS